MIDQLCGVSGCARPVQDAFVCQDCTDQLLGDLRRIISGHQHDATVRNVLVGEDEYYAVGRPMRHRVRTGVRSGKPVEVDEIRPGDFARRMSSRFDHNGGLAHDLDATLDRQARIGAGCGRSSSETALVWHERAGELRMKMCSTLVRYARIVAAARSVDLPFDAEPLTVASWLILHGSWLRYQLVGAAAVWEIHQVVTETMQVIDRAADRWYAGPCTAEPDDEPDGYCGEDLYAKPDSPTVTCRRCGQRYDMAERRRWLTSAAEDQLAHAELIGRAASSFGVDVTPAAIRGYAHRGRIVAHGHDVLLRPLYRIGDVIRVATEIAAERERRAAKRAG